MINTKIMIFEGNSPWGVIKHPTKGNIYKHVLNFPDLTPDAFGDTIKDKFINKFLCNDKRWKDEFKKIEDSASIEFINEYKFNFQTTLTEQGNRFKTYNDMVQSDIAMTKDKNGVYFWTLMVVDRDAEWVKFQAELDVFFTLNIEDNMFYPNAYNFVEQAHVKRYKNNGYPDWEVINKNNLEMNPAKQESIPLYETTKNNDFTTFIKRLDKWVIIYVLNAGNDLKNFFEKLGIQDTTDYPVEIGGVQKQPWTALLIPTSKNEVYSNDNTISNQIIINEILNKCGSHILKIEVVNHLGLSDINAGDIFQAGWEDTANSKLRIKPHDNVYCVKATPIKDVSNFANQGNHKISFMYVNDLSQALPETLKMKKIDTTLKDKDPIIFHPAIFKIALETWNGETKYYSLHRIIRENTDTEWKIINILNTYTPEDDGGIAWIEPNDNYQKDKLLNTNFLNLGSGANLPILKDNLTEYMKNSGNSWKTRKNYDIQQGKANIIQRSVQTGLGLIGGLATAAAGAPTAAAGAFGAGVSGGFGIYNSVINFNRNNDMRKSFIKDLENQTPETTIGQSYNMEVILNNKTPKGFTGQNGMVKLKGSIYKLTTGQEKMLLDKVNVFGYEVMENRQIKDLINTRKTFNYIQAHDLFNSVQLKISAPLKQIINSAFAEGLTIWHVRDHLTFRGILDYDADNEEI